MRELNGAEALMGFLSWLTTREVPVSFSARHDAGLAVRLFEQFKASNAIGALGPDWPECYTVPFEEKIPLATDKELEDFEGCLCRLLNYHSLENASNTPDFILTDYLKKCLEAFNATLVLREAWHGRPIHQLPQEMLSA